MVSEARADLANVKEDLRAMVAQDQLARELAGALNGLFEITSYRRFKSYGGNYVGLFAKPTKTVRASMSIQREVFIAIANYAQMHARTITVCKEVIAQEEPRLQPDLCVVVHADPEGDDNLRMWGREAGVTILPIYRSPAGALPPAAIVRQRLARELFSTDSFQVTGPVSDDIDFFGRREQANEILRQLQSGRISALFGLRKVGKTSMLNRIIERADKAGSPKVAMIDCSIRGFNELSATDALKVVARVARLANDLGYAHVSQGLRRLDEDLMTTFDGLWASGRNSTPLLIVFDEVDYITPDSPTSRHWSTQFNDFWREFRALVQESRRHNFTLSVLVTGVSSKSFREAEVDGAENSVLHFVPEEYLSPFADGAADAMIVTLAKRCGLEFDVESRNLIAKTAGYLPYWIRMCGSYIHRHVEVDDRPVMVDASQVAVLCKEFAETEGAEISRVALQNLRRVDDASFRVLERISSGENVVPRVARPLSQYGLVRARGRTIAVESDLVRRGLDLLKSQDRHPGIDEAGQVTASRTLELNDSEWAEELAQINRRRNLLEKKSREFVRVVLKMSTIKGQSWDAKVRASVPQSRREELEHLTSDALMSKLYWIELKLIISREWSAFEQFFDDKRRTQAAFDLLNERPDAHAKEVDLADVALQRRELDWLEKRIAS